MRITKQWSILTCQEWNPSLITELQLPDNSLDYEQILILAKLNSQITPVP